MDNKHVFSDQELLRYARQILLPNWDVAAQLQLKKSHVVLVGAGGLGCPIALSLVRAGIGKISLVDFDVVEPSNLQRQNLFFDNDVGKSKAAIAAKQLKKHNEWTEIYPIVRELTPDNSVEIFKEADLIIDATDNFSVRDIINKTCVTVQKPFISAAAVGMQGQLALYDFSPKNPNFDEQACYSCVFGNEADEAQRCSEIGVLTTTTQIVGNYAAHLALIFLGQGVNPLENKLMIWNGCLLSQKHIKVTKDEDCNICNNRL